MSESAEYDAQCPEPCQFESAVHRCPTGNSVFGARPFAIERQLGRDLGMTASYIWNRGVQLYWIRDLNLPALGSTSFTYTIADAGGNRREARRLPFIRHRPDSCYASVSQDENGVTSSCNGRAVQLSKQFSTVSDERPYNSPTIRVTDTPVPGMPPQFLRSTVLV